jgi:Fe-S-cluster containining protein
METARRLDALKRVNALYDRLFAEEPTACRPGCRHCCTTRVVATTLEGFGIWEALAPGEAERLAGRLAAASGLPRARMRETVNALAARCADEEGDPGEEAEEGRPEEGSAACPLIAGELCSIYALRPFGCRGFVSRRTCAAGGAAEVDDFRLAVNSVFLQVIEHLDAGGCSGNLLDVLAALREPGRRREYAAGRLHCSGSGLTANRPLAVLMVPPELRERIAPVLKALRAIRL